MSSSRQGFYSRFRISSGLFRRLMNCWPPFLGMRIHIEQISPDWRHVRVRMKLSWRNRNFVGSHFGGGLFTMSDSFFMIMMMHQLGNDYLVWDKSARIDYVAPGRTTVCADFRLTGEQVEEVKRKTAGGEKFEPTYALDILDTAGQVVAHVEKTLYIRKKKAIPGEKPRAGA